MWNMFLIWPMYSLIVVAKLSVIVPVFNEEAELPKLIDLFMQSPCPIECEWIFVDDHTSEESDELLMSLQKKHGFKVVGQRSNQG